MKPTRLKLESVLEHYAYSDHGPTLKVNTGCVWSEVRKPVQYDKRIMNSMVNIFIVLNEIYRK